MPTYILGIESSCDDTSASVLCDGKILSNLVANQEIHKSYGGVVPELASRAHQQNIIPVVNQAISKANIDKNQLNAIAYTRGPGLLGSLLVGSSFSKSLSIGLDIPLIEVNHMQAHLLVHFIDDCGPKPSFPFVGVTISGGHTQIVKVNSYFEMHELGKTLDDAAGEAFDKSGKVIGLKYPAGPEIDKLSKKGDPNKFKFTKPKVSGLNFSFSGLKTNFLNFINKQVRINEDFVKDNLYDICASLQHVIVDILMDKLIKASKETGINTIVICGGVSANSEIRKILKVNSEKHNWKVHIPKLSYTTDNAAMIAMTGQLKFENNIFSDYETSTNPRLKI